MSQLSVVYALEQDLITALSMNVPAAALFTVTVALMGRIIVIQQAQEVGLHSAVSLNAARLAILQTALLPLPRPVAK